MVGTVEDWAQEEREEEEEEVGGKKEIPVR